MSTLTMLVLIGFIEGFLHYISKREVLGRDLPRPVAYVLGTLGMMVPFTAWLLERGYSEIAQTLWWVLCVGGSVVLVTYAFDWVRKLVADLREAKRREKAALTAMTEALDVTQPREQ